MRNKKGNRLPGFTLIEVVIAMTISGIILASAVKIMILLLSVASSENRSSAHNNDILFLHTVLNENFINSLKILNSDINDIDFIYSTKDTTKILFHPSEIIISKGNYIDTVRIKYQNFKIFTLSENSPLISKISFSISYNNLIYNFNFRKVYPSQAVIDNTD